MLPVLDFGHLSAKIATLAAGQWGYVTRTQLLALGMPSRTIASWVRRGYLIPVHAGVYAVGHLEPGPIPRAAAAVLACGPRALLSHDSAAALWGLRRWPHRVEVSTPSQRRRPGIVTHRRPGLTPGEATAQLAIRVTTPARTIADIAPRLTDDEVMRAADTARLNGHLGRQALATLIAMSPRARRLLDAAQSPSRSRLERDFMRWIAEHDLPTPLLNARVNGREADAFFPAHRLIVEIDGWDFHQDRRTFVGDREKDTDAKAHGLDTIRLTAERLTADEAARLKLILDGQVGRGLDQTARGLDQIGRGLGSGGSGGPGEGPGVGGDGSGPGPGGVGVGPVGPGSTSEAFITQGIPAPRPG